MIKQTFKIDYQLKCDEQGRKMLFISSYQNNIKIEEHFVGYIIDTMKKDRELCLSGNIEEIEKNFEPCTECKECHFCMKPNYDFLPEICLLYAEKIEDERIGCLGGYKKKEMH